MSIEKILEKAFDLINDESFKDFIRKTGNKIIIFNNAFKIFRYEEKFLEDYFNKIITIPYELIKITSHSKIINCLDKNNDKLQDKNNEGKSEIYIAILESEENIEENINYSGFETYNIDFNYFFSIAREKVKS